MRALCGYNAQGSGGVEALDWAGTGRRAVMVRGQGQRMAGVALAALLLVAPALAWLVRPAGPMPRPAYAAPARADAAATRPAVHTPAVQAKSAYLMDANTGEALFQKFPHTRRPMASTTKLMTGLLAAE